MRERIWGLLHVFWWLTLGAAVVIVLASLPGYWYEGTVGRVLTAPSMPAQSITWLGIAFSITATCVSLALACILFWKKPQDAMAFFLSIYLMVYAIVLCGPEEALVGYWLPQYMEWIYWLQYVFFLAPSLALILVFPHGSFKPRWTRFLVLIGGGVAVVSLFFDPEEMVKFNTMRSLVIGVIEVTLLLAALGLQVYRYRTRYTLVERQQTKWVGYGTLLSFGVLLLVSLPYYYIVNLPPDAPLPWWNDIGTAGWWFGLNILPVAFTVAILHSRLWDIDVLIRRTVTYGLLAALLAVIYFGSVIVLQRLFANVSGQRSEVITVLSTLVLAALFVPLRNFLQNSIDRRFNRKRYDAQKVLHDFAATVRDETDLAKLAGDLVQVVNETMQPRSVSLWLKAESTRPDAEQGFMV